MEAKYRIRVDIYDDEQGEIVTFIDEPLMSTDEDNVAHAYRALAQFSKLKESHEQTYYPKEEADV